MAGPDFDQIAWVRPSHDEHLAAKSRDALQLLSELQRSLEFLVLPIPDAISDQRNLYISENSTGLAAFDTPQLRHSLDAITKELRRIERLASGYSNGNARVESYGRLSIFRGRAPFFRGHLDRYIDIPLMVTGVAGVMHFLQTIPKIGDKLKRENHAHFGIHYHYLSSDEARSNTILCFRHDQGWPLFSERHAEKGSEFDARPGAWSVKKRTSVYGVLESEPKRFPAKEFRRPSSEAAIVWKAGAKKIADL